MGKKLKRKQRKGTINNENKSKENYAVTDVSCSR